MNRCPWAIKGGVTLTTRCTLTEGHEEALPREPKHVGRGLPAFPYQRIMWLPGDRREFKTERTDEYAWEAKP